MDKGKNNRILFEQMPIRKAVWTLALPTMASMLVTVFYNLADTFFVGQTNDKTQVAAVSLVMPVFLIMVAFGNLFGMGGSTVISRLLGEKKSSKVKQVSSFCFYGALGTGVIIGVLALIFMDSIVPLTGAKETTHEFVKEYLTYIAIGAPFIIVSNAFGNIVRSDGSAKQAMIGMMIGTVTNIILDPIMILALDMGVVGAAIATIIGNIFATLYYVYLLLKPTSVFSLNPKDIKIEKKQVGSIFAIGIPAAINNLLMSIASIIYNIFLAKYGDAPIAAMGIAMKCNTLIIMLLMGLTMGAQPIIGYNFGSQNFQRMKKVIRYIMVVGIIIGVILAGIFIIAANPIVSAFINDSEVIEYGSKMLRIQAITASVLAVMFVSMSAMQSMGKAIPTLILSICRQGLVFIPAAYIADRISGLEGLIWAQPIADVISVIMSGVLLILVYRKLPYSASLPKSNDEIQIINNM